MKKLEDLYNIITISYEVNKTEIIYLMKNSNFYDIKNKILLELLNFLKNNLKIKEIDNEYFYEYKLQFVYFDENNFKIFLKTLNEFLNKNNLKEEFMKLLNKNLEENNGGKFMKKLEDLYGDKN